MEQHRLVIWSFIRGDTNNLHELWTLNGCYAYASHHPQLKRNWQNSPWPIISYKNLSTLPFLTYFEVLRLETSWAWSGRREPTIDGTVRLKVCLSGDVRIARKVQPHSNLIRFQFRLNWNLKPPMIFITYLSSSCRSRKFLLEYFVSMFIFLTCSIFTV